MFSLLSNGFSFNLIQRKVYKQLLTTKISRTYGRFATNFKIFIILIDAVTKSGRDHCCLEIVGENACLSLNYASIFDTHTRVYVIRVSFFSRNFPQ